MITFFNIFYCQGFFIRKTRDHLVSSIFRSLWQYRSFIWSSICNELKSRFARSKLGLLWVLIHPLAQVVIYALILSNVMSAKLPGIENKYAYVIYLMAGQLAWTLFSEIISRLLSLFIDQANLIKKMRFPRVALPAIVLGSSLINNFSLLIATLSIFWFLGHPLAPSMFWLLPLTLLLSAFALGVGLIFAVLNVFLRDVGQVVPIAMQLWFWCTPVIYPATIIPEDYRHWLDFNPIYPIINSYQQVLVYGNGPHLESLYSICTFTLVFIFLGLFLFRRSNEEMVDAL